MRHIVSSYIQADFRDGTRGNADVALHFYKQLKRLQKRNPALFQALCSAVRVQGAQELRQAFRDASVDGPGYGCIHPDNTAEGIRLCTHQTKLGAFFNRIGLRKNTFELVHPLAQPRNGTTVPTDWTGPQGALAPHESLRPR